MRTLERSQKIEWLDDERVPASDLELNLRDLRFINHWAGGNLALLTPLKRLLLRWPKNQPLRILDVGSGGGDLVKTILELGRKMGLAPVVVGLDHSVQVLSIARSFTNHHRGIHWVRGEALSLPFARDSFDYVISSLVLHHIHPSQGAAFLRELSRVAKAGVLVSDLRRGRWEYAWAFFFTRLFSRCRVTLHDAPLSVLRSLTLAEARALVVEAGWEEAQVGKRFPLRMLLTNSRPSGTPTSPGKRGDLASSQSGLAV